MKNFNKILTLLIALAASISSVSASQKTFDSSKIKQTFTAATIFNAVRNSLSEAYKNIDYSLSSSPSLTSERFRSTAIARNLNSGSRLAILTKIATTSAINYAAKNKAAKEAIQFAEEQELPETADFLRRTTKFFGMQK